MSTPEERIRDWVTNEDWEVDRVIVERPDRLLSDITAVLDELKAARAKLAKVQRRADFWRTLKGDWRMAAAHLDADFGSDDE